MIDDPRYRPSVAHRELGDVFYDAVTAARFPAPVLRFRNQRWAERVGLGSLSEEAWESHFARFEPLPGSHPQPLALRYHGHQFRSYNPDLGDGRGFLFAQLHDDSGRLLDLGTKGSGRTPWSRGGDGRLTLKGGVREVLATEMLEALGVATSKSFSLFETGESLERHDEPSPTRASALVRLSHSHIRFGTFQRLRYADDTANTTRLVEHVLAHHYPSLVDETDLPLALQRVMVERYAELVASWMVAGFVHGVLNTDNMNVTGESFDYGPWRFLPHYDPRFTAAYFDETGLYAYARQPEAVLWNLARLAECLLPASPSAVTAFEGVLRAYGPAMRRALVRRFLERLGVCSVGEDDDERLMELGFAFLEERRAGFAQFFHDWYGGEASTARAFDGPAKDAYRGERFDAFREALSRHAPVDVTRLGLDYFQRGRPCDLRIDEVEALWAPIASEDDWTAFEWKVQDLRRMGEALALPIPRSTGSPMSATD